MGGDSSYRPLLGLKMFRVTSRTHDICPRPFKTTFWIWAHPRGHTPKLVHIIILVCARRPDNAEGTMRKNQLSIYIVL